MLTQQTLDKLYAMKLNGMADALKSRSNNLTPRICPSKNDSASSSIVNGPGRKIDA